MRTYAGSSGSPDRGALGRISAGRVGRTCSGKSVRRSSRSRATESGNRPPLLTERKRIWGYEVDRTFRIVVFSSVPPGKLRHFLWRLGTDLPDVQVAGVLYETGRAPLPLSTRVKRVAGLLLDREYRAFALHKLL